MPVDTKDQRRPADVIGRAVKIARILMMMAKFGDHRPAGLLYNFKMPSIQPLTPAPSEALLSNSPLSLTLLF
jgi:hypothetical protein